MTATAAPACILLVEDSPDDVLLTEEALRRGRMARGLRVVRDGETALDFLYRRGKYANEARPDLVLLDLNLPRMDGMEVLQDMKNNPQLRTVPVVALTSSRAERDVLRAYDNYVNAYIIKPLDVDEFVRTVRSVEDFYLRTACLSKAPSADPFALPF